MSPEAEPLADASAAQDLEAYLTGASNASEYIQLAVPELVLPQLPLRSVRIMGYRLYGSGSSFPLNSSHPRLLLLQLLQSLGLCPGTQLARPPAAPCCTGISSRLAVA